MAFFIYIMKSDEGRYYIGSTDDIEKRICAHNEKRYKAWTSRYNNWKLVHSESFPTRTEAIAREKKIKKMKGGTAFKNLITSTGS